MNTTPAPDPKAPLITRLKKYLRGLLMRMLVYFAAYLLIAMITIGPCYWYLFESVYVDGPKWIQKFYAPLLFLCEYFPLLGWLVSRYIDWWIL